MPEIPEWQVTKMKWMNFPLDGVELSQFMSNVDTIRRDLAYISATMAGWGQRRPRGVDDALCRAKTMASHTYQMLIALQGQKHQRDIATCQVQKQSHLRLVASAQSAREAV